MRSEVVIVGAGPAGLVLAWLLQRAGVGTVVVEQQPREELGLLPKAGIVEYRTVELLTAEGLAGTTGGTVLPFAAENRRCEFRTADESVVIDYGELTGGRPHYVFPQHELVAKVAASYLERGGTLLFERRVTAVEQDAEGARVRTDQEEITADVVVGCDGAGSVVARSVADRVTRHERQHPMRMLVISAAMPPLVDHTVYAAHPRGYAAHMRRLPEVTRLYLEVARDSSPADWPAPRLREELGRRLGVGDALAGVELPEVDVIDLRVRVTTPMQHGRVFLVGDAAHLITQAGGKGMNLAIGDAVELAHGLVERHGGDGTRAERYSATRLPVIWRTEAFSDWFLHIMCAPPGAGAARDGFGLGLREGWVSTLQRDPLLRRWFAHAYAGVDPD